MKTKQLVGLVVAFAMSFSALVLLCVGTVEWWSNLQQEHVYLFVKSSGRSLFFVTWAIALIADLYSLVASLVASSATTTEGGARTGQMVATILLAVLCIGGMIVYVYTDPVNAGFHYR